MNLFKDLIEFGKAMASLPWTIQLWAALYPLPQLIGGLYFIQETPGLVILLGRLASFIIGSQVHRRRPFSKLIGPIGHAHWLLILPYLFFVLAQQSVGPGLYGFISYVCILTLISGVIDIRDWLDFRRHGESFYQR